MFLFCIYTFKTNILQKKHFCLQIIELLKFNITVHVN